MNNAKIKIIKILKMNNKTKMSYKEYLLAMNYKNKKTC